MIKRLIWLLPMLVIVGLDQYTKYLISSTMQENESITVIKDVLHFTFIYNDGMALGLLDNSRWVFMLFSTVSIVAILVVMIKFYDKYYHPLLWTALAFIAGGGIGNMIDRIALGKVVDFVNVICIPFWHYIFNVADIFVCIGCPLIILYLILDELRIRKQKQADSKSE